MPGLDLTTHGAAIREELAQLAAEAERVAPSHRATRREVRVPAHACAAARWFWEAFGYGELSRHCIAPDDAIAQVSARMTLVEWCDRDPRYGEIVAQVELEHDLVAASATEVVVVSRRQARQLADPPLLCVRAPSQSADAPELEPRSDSALRFMTSAPVGRLWADMVRVILALGPPVTTVCPFPWLAPFAARSVIEAVPVWVIDAQVHGRPGCSIYFDPAAAERIDAWIGASGLADHVLV